MMLDLFLGLALCHYMPTGITSVKSEKQTLNFLYSTARW